MATVPEAPREDAEAPDAPGRTDAAGGRRPDASAPCALSASVDSVSTEAAAEAGRTKVGKRRHPNGCRFCGLPGHRQAECPNALEMVEKGVIPWFWLGSGKRRARRRR